VASLAHGFSEIAIATANEPVGKVTTAWGASATIVSKQAVAFVRWNANPVVEKHQLNPQVRSGKIGTLTVSAGRIRTGTDLLLAKPLAGPSFWWRLTRH